MRELARKLMNLSSTSESSGLPSAIFGNISELSQNLEIRVPFRVGMWPCIAEESPEVAMGLMAVLASLLERRQDILVYPIFLRMDELPDDYEWAIQDSQFSVDDWQFEGLDDNIGLWGTLKREASTWVLTLEVENDFDDDTHTYTYRGESINDLVNQLPPAADQIAADLGADNLLLNKLQPYTPAHRDDQPLQDLLKSLLRWEVNLLLYLADYEWDSRADHQTLVDQAKRVGGEFGAWVTAYATSRAMLPGFGLIVGESLLPVEDVIAAFPNEGIVLIELSNALYRLGEADLAVSLLEAEVEQQPSRVDAWLALTDLQRQRGQMSDAVDAFQRAIEADAVNATLFANYGVLLPMLEATGWKLNEFILIDPQELDGYYVRWEAIEAFEEALKHSPENPADLLSQQLGLLFEIDRESDRFWQTFERLVKADKTGEYVRVAVDQFYMLNEPEPGLDTLEKVAEAEPDRVDVHVNLAVAYLAAEEHDAALQELDHVRDIAKDPTVIADIDRLTLSAEDPEFEAQLGEIMDKVSAENKLTAEEVEFLESVVESAPTYSEVYQLLARAYVLWEEHGTALETLLDAEKHLPDDPDILEGIARLLWHNDQRELALQYINRSLEKNPIHIPTLAFGGQCLFEDGKEDEARAYLSRAEAIAPQHPALARARTYISRLMAED